MPEDDNYYPTEEAMPAAESEPTDDVTETATLPKSFFGDKEKKPGDRCEVEVVRLYDDEVEVKYIPHADKEESEEGGHDEAMTKSFPEEESGGY